MTGSLRKIRIGTRASALARWQAEHVADRLRGLDGAPEPELVLIRTQGDRIQDVPLSKVQGKAFFTKEIEDALLREHVDVAVHSLKDLATRMPTGLALGAVLEREDPRDAMILSPRLGEGPEGQEAREAFPSPRELPRGSRVGTSSLRRRSLLARWRPDLSLPELRGNVPTRIRKLDQGEYDAIVLAAAGVRRLQLTHRISAFLPLTSFLPAVSQGAIGVQIRSGDGRVGEWVEKLDHPETRQATEAERAFLRTLEGGCQVPVGAFGALGPNGLELRGVISSLDGRRSVEGDRRGPPDEAQALGFGLAEELLLRGGGKILEEIRSEVAGE